jgi:hypothetical protein
MKFGDAIVAMENRQRVARPHWREHKGAVHQYRYLELANVEGGAVVMGALERRQFVDDRRSRARRAGAVDRRVKRGTPPADTKERRRLELVTRRTGAVRRQAMRRDTQNTNGVSSQDLTVFAVARGVDAHSDLLGDDWEICQ